MNTSKTIIFNLTIIFILCCLIVTSNGALIKRSPDSEVTTSTVSTEKTTMTTVANKRRKDSICGIKNVCGWAIYFPRTRFIDYFMEADCDCDPPQKCFKAEDDISLSAYVYRCKLETSDKS